MLQPESEGTLDSRGAVPFRLRRHTEAMQDFDRALEPAPGMESTRYLRAVALAGQGDFAAAHAEAEAVRKGAPDTVAGLERAGFVLKNEQADAAD